MNEPKMTKDGKIIEESIGIDNKPRLQDNRDEAKDEVTPTIDPLKHQKYDPDVNPLQGTPPDENLPNNELSGTSSTNQEELDLPRFDGSTLAGQPRNDPERNFPKH